MGELAHIRDAREPGPGTAMRARLAGFAHTLRVAGFAIGCAEVQDAARLLATPIADRPEKLCGALRALFSSRHSDLGRFDELFDAFWRGRGAKRATRVTAQGSCRSFAAQIRDRTGRRRSTRRPAGNNQCAGPLRGHERRQGPQRRRLRTGGALVERYPENRRGERPGRGAPARPPRG